MKQVMNIKMKASKQYLLLGLLWLATASLMMPSLANAEQETDHGHSETGEQDEHQQPGLVEISAESKDLFKLQVERLQFKDIAKQITAPGEVVLNAYKTAIVALRIDGQVVKRLVKMGDTVVKGQPLAALSSIQMAEAQQAYILDAKEWFRVKQLGRQVVSGKRFIEANSKWQSSKARLEALGLDEKQLQVLAKKQNPDGMFTANAPIDGLVVSDDFIEGQYIAAGGQLFMVSDENVIWVEASVSPSQAALFSAGDVAEIEHDGERHSGKIVQISHLISESTRTQKIRIEIDNHKDDLHPGQFVQCLLSQAQTEKHLAIPEKALVRTADGDWAVFVESKALHYQQVEVELIRRQGDLMIISGLEKHTPVVIEGAFYLAAELAKSGFDPHGH